MSAAIASEFVILRQNSLLEALNKIQSLGAILGRDCRLKPDSYDLELSVDFIDALIENDLRQQPEPIAPDIVNHPPVQRSDRIIEPSPEQSMELLQIETAYQQAWIDAEEDRDLEFSAIQNRKQARSMLRERIIKPFAEIDAANGSTLCYGGQFPNAICLDSPDGQAYQVHTLIHFTNPVSPEDLYLRELRVTAQHIVRYHVPGLDDSEWLMQNEPRDKLDCAGWRSLLLKRCRHTAIRGI